MAHQREHGGLRNTVLGHSGSEGVPEIVETARDLGILPQFIPAPSQIRSMACRIRCTPRKEVVLFLGLSEFFHEPRSMLGKYDRQIVVDRNHSPRAVRRLGPPNCEPTGLPEK